ncbi:MAG: Tfp pilus assembly protein FimT/FimU [Candidatus Spyradenecus sp.]
MKRGFTLIELLVVLAILGIAVAVVVPHIGNSASTQVSMAAKDTLRLMRYARNMALQTQQPMEIIFSPGQIVLSSAFDEGASASSTRGEPVEAEVNETSPKRSPGVTVEAGEIDAVGLTKHYDQVAFAFLGYDDSVTQGRSAEDGAPADFRRRVPGQESVQGTRAGLLGGPSAEETFSITVRANGTTRPFSLRVLSREDLERGEETGDKISFDFLCAGTIGEQ